MTYYAKEGKGFWLVLLAFAVLNLIFLNERISYMAYLLVIVILIGMFMNYQLNINDDWLELKINVFSFTFINRKIDPNNIKEMYFIQLGKKPNVLIKLKKGIRWKIANFSPEDFDKELYQFAKKHEIKISKLNGYKVGEGYKKVMSDK